jgi:UPF0755 protein
MRGCLTTLRNLLIPLFLAALLVACVGGVAVLLISRNTPTLNPLEAAWLRISLSLRGQELSQPTTDNSTDTAQVCFTVDAGDTPSVVASKLNARNFRLDPELFRNYVRYFGIDSKIQAGTFLLTRQMTIPQIAQKLTDAELDTKSLLLIEGWRLEEVAAAIDQYGFLFTGADFFRLAGPESGSTGGYVADFKTRQGIAPGKSLEGFLFPDTYTIPPCATAEDVLIRVLQNFEARVSPQMRADLSQTGLSLYEAISLASIVQREAFLDEERPTIAGVYLNRLRNSRSSAPSTTMPVTLDADPTVQYALGNTRDPKTWWPMLTVADYRGVSSAFNTYLNTGLPPTPIASPGLASIRAAIYPTPSNYAFFRACGGEGGRHRFSETFAQHTVACP